MNVTKESLSDLRDALPKNYGELIQSKLKKKGTDYSVVTIKNNILGKFLSDKNGRKPNMEIIAAGYEVAKGHKEYLDSIEEIRDNL